MSIIKRRLYFWFIITATCSIDFQASPNINLTTEIHNSNNLNIIPAPVKITQHQEVLTFRNVKVKTTGFRQIPLQLVNLANEVFTPGRTVFQQTYQTETTLLMNLDTQSDLPEEGYVLNVNSQGITITARREAGIFYGLQTCMQLITYQQNTEQITLPCVEIEDYPRFAYRGLLLDVGRHFFPVSFIKEYIDLMSQYKLNILHWHLTEDQGWRIEIKKYPKLTEIGSFREQTLVGHLRNKPQRFDAKPHGGYYTQDEVREIVAYAASKYITIIPEIEMPGHALAALASYHELGCGDNPGPFKVSEKWGVHEDVYCAGKEQTFRFIEDVLEEVLDLFPSEYIHIGGDECPKGKWKTCPHCQTRIIKEQLRDENELQSYFIRRIEKYLNKKGRLIIGWDEILEGGLARNATVMSWRGTKGGIEAANQKHNVILTPNTYLYFDYCESKSSEEPITIGKNLPMQKVYGYEPLSNELTTEQHHYIKGVQANLWTEFITTQKKAYYMLFPRFFALSEVAWSLPVNKNWQQFSENRLPVHLFVLDKKGLTYRVPEPIGAKDTTIYADELTINLKVPVSGAKIFYSTNGYTPTEMDEEYTSPFTIKTPIGEEISFKSVVVTPSGRKSVVVCTTIKSTILQTTIP